MLICITSKCALQKQNTSKYIDSLVYLHKFSELDDLKHLPWFSSRWDNPETGCPPVFWQKNKFGKEKQYILSVETVCFPAMYLILKQAMTKTLATNKISLLNMLLIAGNGRNVGKTTLACRIITHLAKSNEVTAIKISSHLHEYKSEPLVKRQGEFVILLEKEQNQKDSSLMLQAGARNVFFVMAKKKSLDAAFESLLPFLDNHPIICESGGLHHFIQPGIFLFVNEKDRVIEKQEHLEFHPILVENNGIDFDLDIESIHFADNKIKLSE